MNANLSSVERGKDVKKKKEIKGESASLNDRYTLPAKVNRLEERHHHLRYRIQYMSFVRLESSLVDNKSYPF